MRDGRAWLESLLGLFAQVRRGEGVRALLLTANIFVLLVAYYLLKVVREPLVLTGGTLGMSGATLKAAAATGQAILLSGVVPAYAWLAARADRMRLINVVTGIFAACLIGFYCLGGAGVSIGFPFFIWLGIFNVLVVAQFWSFASDVYTPAQGKRLFAIVGFGQTSGAVAGSALAAWLIPHLGAYNLMLVAAALLVVALALGNRVHQMGRRREPAVRPAVESRRGGFKLVLANRYLLLVAFLTLVYNTVNSNGEFILGATVVDHARAVATSVKQQQEIIGGFYGGYFGAINILTAALQLFAVSRVLEYGGVRAALLVMPIISLGGYALVATMPIFGIIRVAKILENGIDYSLQNTTRQALFLPTTRAEKYQAKAAIDTFFVRIGDVLSLALVAVVTGALGLGVKAMAVLNVALVVVWIALAVVIGRRYDRALAAPPARARI